MASIHKSNEFTSHQYHYDKSIKLDLLENSHKVKFLRESLNASVDSIKMIVKHCTTMNKQIEQMASLQSKLYEKLFANEKQVYGVKIGGGSSTQDRNYPEGIREEES
jgi:hypothetical protein